MNIDWLLGFITGAACIGGPVMIAGVIVALWDMKPVVPLVPPPPPWGPDEWKKWIGRR